MTLQSARVPGIGTAGTARCPHGLLRPHCVGGGASCPALPGAEADARLWVSAAGSAAGTPAGGSCLPVQRPSQARVETCSRPLASVAGDTGPGGAWTGGWGCLLCSGHTPLTLRWFPASPVTVLSLQCRVRPRGAPGSPPTAQREGPFEPAGPPSAARPGNTLRCCEQLRCYQRPEPSLRERSNFGGAVSSTPKHPH